jgi:hypothetical protein
MSGTASDLKLRCRCGTVHGRVRGASPRTGTHLVCYCDDCQRFATVLGAAEDVLDAHGGTDVLHISPARIELTSGTDRIACLRLTPRGIFRWYASCCNTPIGNTLPMGKVPFLSLIDACLHCDEGTLDDVIGPVRARLQGRFAVGDTAQLAIHPRAPLGMVLRAARKTLGWWLRGDQRRSPFFKDTNTPIVEPQLAPKAPSS